MTQRSLRGWHVRRALAIGALATLAGVVTAGGCAQEPIEVDVRSLERSGRVSFVCLASPSLAAEAALPVGACQGTSTDTPGDYSSPHLYALVTQTTRGEIAVIDLTSDNDSVIDQDRRVPGANFLPVGAQPVDIASSPGSTATFVAVAEVGRRGIFALPSTQIRPDLRGELPTLSSWPACALDFTPGNILVLSDPPDEHQMVRARCDAERDINVEGAVNPDRKNGRLKLLVTLPDEGGFVIIDAEELLARPPGSFDACPIERWVPLEVELGQPTPPPQPPQEQGCVLPPEPEPTAATYRSRPAGLAFADGRLYVADLEAPVIHVLDMPSPCDAVERPPLLPFSAEDPERVVITSRLAVTPGQTSDFKRYLYAIDYIDGSVMVFDVSDSGGGNRRPLFREAPEENPFVPRDRIRFGTARDIAIIETDVPLADPATGIAQTGIFCDPDPACTTSSGTCPPQAPLYRTSGDYKSGAGPLKIRGTFAYVLLSSGQIVVVDIEDFDAACRGPVRPHPIFGCEKEVDAPLLTSGEVSCDVVIPHTVRGNHYFLSGAPGPHQPGVQTAPLLYDNNGSLLQAADDPGVPRLRATVPEVPLDDASPPQLTLAVGGNLDVIDTDTGFVFDEDGQPVHTLAMNFDDPHAHLVDQMWHIRFEGPLPGFSTRFGALRIDTAEEDDEEGLDDAASRFCDAGVQSQAAVRELLGEDASEDEVQGLADHLQINADLPAEASPHWGTVTNTCSFETCRATFGTKEAPTPQRDLRILEAFQDRLVLADSDDPKVPDSLIKCCFPGVVGFNIRPSRQWVVTGDASGFLHHTIEDPVTGVCRSSCDPIKSRLNGRLRTSPGGSRVVDQDPRDVHPLVGYVDDDGVRRFPFKNSMFRLAITQCPTEDDCEPRTIGRDVEFQFPTIGQFVPLVIGLGGDTGEIAPQAISVDPANGRLAVTDGTLEGLLLVSPQRLDVLISYF